MFFKKIVKTEHHLGKRYDYYRLCETYRVGGHPKHRSIISVGRLEDFTHQERRLLAEKIESLIKNKINFFEKIGVSGYSDKINQKAHEIYDRIAEQAVVSAKSDSKPSCKQSNKTKASLEQPHSVDNTSKNTKEDDSRYVTIDTHSFEHKNGREVGAEWLCYQALEQLSMGNLLLDLGFTKDQMEKALMHIIAKAVHPTNEHNTARWMRTNTALMELFNQAPSKANHRHLYPISRMLYNNKEHIESYLSNKTSQLFNVDDKIMLYDLTNTYFEGRVTSSNLAKFGRSKEKRTDCKQVVLAIVVNSAGFIKHSHIFEGNMADSTSLSHIIDHLRKATCKNTQQTPVIAIDAGIATEANLKLLRDKKYHYVCVTRSKLKDYKLVDSSESSITTYDKKDNPIEIRRIEKANDSDQYFRVYSQQKELKEESMNSKITERLEEELNYLAESIHRKSCTKRADKIHERIGRIKERYTSVIKYYNIKVKQQGDLATKISFNRLEAPKENTSGIYFLRTNIPEIDNKTTWTIYNTLTEAEATFRTLKTDLSLRPIFHRTDANIKAHLFLGVLAYQVVNTLRHQLKSKGICYGWSTLVGIMNTQKMVTSTMNTIQNKCLHIRSCTEPVVEVQCIYQALKYKDRPFYQKKFVVPG